MWRNAASARRGGVVTGRFGLAATESASQARATRLALARGNTWEHTASRNQTDPASHGMAGARHGPSRGNPYRVWSHEKTSMKVYYTYKYIYTSDRVQQQQQQQQHRASDNTKAIDGGSDVQDPPSHIFFFIFIFIFFLFLFILQIYPACCLPPIFIILYIVLFFIIIIISRLSLLCCEIKRRDVTLTILGLTSRATGRPEAIFF